MVMHFAACEITPSCDLHEFVVITWRDITVVAVEEIIAKSRGPRWPWRGDAGRRRHTQLWPGPEAVRTVRPQHRTPARRTRSRQRYRARHPLLPRADVGPKRQARPPARSGRRGHRLSTRAAHYTRTTHVGMGARAERRRPRSCIPPRAPIRSSRTPARGTGGSM